MLLAAGVGVLLTGLVEARSGPTRPLVIVLVLGGLVLLGVWLASSTAAGAPMIDPALFRSPTFLRRDPGGARDRGGDHLDDVVPAHRDGTRPGRLGR